MTLGTSPNSSTPSATTTPFSRTTIPELVDPGRPRGHRLGSSDSPATGGPSRPCRQRSCHAGDCPRIRPIWASGCRGDARSRRHGRTRPARRHVRRTLFGGRTVRRGAGSVVNGYGGGWSAVADAPTAPRRLPPPPVAREPKAVCASPSAVFATCNRRVGAAARSPPAGTPGNTRGAGARQRSWTASTRVPRRTVQVERTPIRPHQTAHRVGRDNPRVRPVAHGWAVLPSPRSQLTRPTPLVASPDGATVPPSHRHVVDVRLQHRLSAPGDGQASAGCGHLAVSETEAGRALHNRAVEHHRSDSDRTVSSPDGSAVAA